MGARPSSFKRGGGFLNNVTGKLVDYVFTDEFNGEPFRPGKDPKTKKDRFHALYFVPSVLVDGADDPVTTTLFVGGADDFEVSEDGKTLTPIEEGRELGGSTAFAKLITSVVESGFPETNLSETDINYEPIIGWRFNFVQKRDEEATKKLGKRVDKKTGREYDRQDLVVDQTFAPEETSKAGKTAKPAAGGAKTGKKPEPQGDDIDTLSADTLKAILADTEDGYIQKSKLSMKVLQKLTKHPQREDVRTRIFSDDFLATEDGWTYNKAKGLVTLTKE